MRMKKRSDASSRQSQRSADVESGWRRARRSRRRVERDASANASRRVRAARPYRERGLLFFVLDACGAVRRRPGETRAVPKVRCAFVVRYFLLAILSARRRRRRARAERARREARRESRDRPLDTRWHSMRGKNRRDRHHERHVPAAEATSRMGDVPVLLVYANPKAKPPPRHALASTLWFRTSRLPTVISGRVESVGGA